MSYPSPEPAPFARGDRVVYRPQPAGAETVETVEWIEKGWPSWYLRTGRPGACPCTFRFAPAADFTASTGPGAVAGIRPPESTAGWLMIATGLAEIVVGLVLVAAAFMAYGPWLLGALLRELAGVPS